ncbi:MAG: T9SS type A sorting domain-containing protein [Flavobacteriales bacterium]|nr:T9SS type A sorting domain-containing protein [Flavobacteriales bacterium]
MPTSISTVPDIAELNVWPNPVGNELNLDFNSIRAGSSIFSVINTDGRTVLQEERTVVLGKNTLELNTASLAPGLYLLRMGVGAQQLAHRFLKVQ